MALDINTVGCEFVKSILKLYRTAKYFREKEILANKLLDSAIEAGARITDLGFCAEEMEDSVAKRAMEELSKAMFILKVMSDEGVYPPRRIEPITTLGREVRELIQPYLKPPAPPQPQQQEQALPRLPEGGKGKKYVDLGGFDEIYIDEKK